MTEVKWLLIPSISQGLFDGGIFTAVWSYVAITTPPKWRAMRMTIVELCAFLSNFILLILNVITHFNCSVSIGHNNQWKITHTQSIV